MRFLPIILLCVFTISSNAQDLVVDYLDYSVPVNQYDSTSIKIGISNIGALDISDKFYFRICFSKDSIYDSGDSYFIFEDIDSLAAGESIEVKKNIKCIDESPGEYYLVVYVDSRQYVEETDETNNYYSSPYTINSAQIDFVINSFSIDKSIYTRYSQVRPKFQIQNSGTDTYLGSSYVNFYLSEDQLFDTNDNLLTSKYISFSSNIVNNDSWDVFSVPGVQTGKYYIIAYVDADNKIEETNKNNNYYVSGQIEIIEADIDLQVVNPGYSIIDYDNVQIYHYLKNNGTTDATDFQVNYYLSIDDTLSQDDFYIGFFEFMGSRDYGLLKAQSETEVLYSEFFLGHFLPSGSYNLLICVNNDSLIEETNYNNNYLNAGPVTIAPYSFEFKIDTVFTEPLVAPVKNLNIKCIITNIGSDANGLDERFDITVKDSTDSAVLYFFSMEFLFLNNNEKTTLSLFKELTNELPSGLYTISISSRSYIIETYSIEINVSAPSYSLSGNILSDSGDPVTGSSVYLYGKNAEGKVTMLDKQFLGSDDADFSFDVAEGLYALFAIPADKNSFLPTVFENSLFIKDTSFIEVISDTLLDFHLIPVVPNDTSLQKGNYSIKGTITDATMDDGRVMSEIPYSNLTLYLLNSDDRIISRTVTDNNGYFEFLNLENQQYYLLPDYNNGQVATPVEVNVNSQIVQVDLTIQHDYTIVSQVEYITGIEGTEIDTNLFYPNPNSGILHFKVGATRNSELTIFNSFGVPVKSFNILKSGQIDISDLTPGYYFLRYQGTTSKLIVK